MSKPKTERNQEIYKKHTQEGLSTYALAFEYRITPPAIFKIIKREERKAKNGKHA